MMEIQPKIQPYADKLNKKLVACPFTKDLDEKKYFTYLRNVKKNIELFREANIPINAELSVLQQQLNLWQNDCCGKWSGIYITAGQKFLEDPDRKLREQVYREEIPGDYRIKRNWMSCLLYLKKTSPGCCKHRF